MKSGLEWYFEITISAKRVSSTVLYVCMTHHIGFESHWTFVLHFCHCFPGGVLSFIASLAGGTVLDVWEFNPYPHHLMTNAPGGVRGTPLNDEE